MNEVEICLFSNDPGVLRLGSTDQIWRQFEHGILIEFRRKTVLGKLDAIAFHSRKSYLKRVSVGAYRFDLNRFAWRAAAARPLAWR